MKKISTGQCITACMLLYLGLSLFVGSTWHHMHDEAWTYRACAGETGLQTWPAESTPAASLHENLSGDAAPSVGTVLEAVSHHSLLNPPAYFLILRGWIGLAGTGRLTIRLPSYLFGVLSVLGIFLLAGRLVPLPGSACWAALLLALSPWHHVMSNFLRPYGMLLCISIWSTCCVLHFFSDRSRSAWRMAFLLLSILGLYTVYHYAFILAWHAIVLGLMAFCSGSGRRRIDLLTLAGIGLLIIVGILPWFPVFLDHMSRSGGRYFAGSAALTEWPGYLVELVHGFLLTDFLDTERWGFFIPVLVALEIGTLILLIGLFFRPSRTPADPAARLLWKTVVIVPVLIAIADIINDTHTLFLRKTCPLLMPVLLCLILLAWHSIPWRFLRIAGLAGWSLLMAAGLLISAFEAHTTKIGYEKLARHLHKMDNSSHLAVLSLKEPGALYPFLLTLREEGVQRVHLVQAPPELLSKLLETVARGADFQRVTLIDMRLKYVHPRRMWTPERLKDLAKRARSFGWKVRYENDGDFGKVHDPKKRVLTITSPVYPKW